MKPQLQVFNYSIVNQSDEAIDVNVDGYIVDSPTLEFYRDYWGDETSVSFKSFRDSIPNGIKTLNVYVNSGGGHVGDAMAIHDFLVELENKGVIVNRQGRGIVASAATYLVMGENSSLSENTLFMIHEVSGYAYGDVSSMENQVKAMRKFNDTIVNFYANKTGLSTTVIGNMMKAETWMNAQEAKEKGFVKNVAGKATITNSIKPEHWQFRNTAMLNTYNNFITNSNTESMDIKKISDAFQNAVNELLDKMGIKKDDDATKNALSDFSTKITNALSEIKVPDEDSVKNMVNTAFADFVKNIGENDAFKNAITEATKNTVTKDDLKTGLDNLTKEVAKMIGNKGKTGESANGNNGQRTTPRNRFSGKYAEPE